MVGGGELRRKAVLPVKGLGAHVLDWGESKYTPCGSSEREIEPRGHGDRHREKGRGGVDRWGEKSTGVFEWRACCFCACAKYWHQLELLQEETTDTEKGGVTGVGRKGCACARARDLAGDFRFVPQCIGTVQNNNNRVFIWKVTRIPREARTAQAL